MLFNCSVIISCDILMIQLLIERESDNITYMKHASTSHLRPVEGMVLGTQGH